jgi:tetratricopeptide (TPR) repeat protein
VYENLGLTYEAMNRADDADKAYRHALDRPDRTYRAWLAYGAFLFKQGRTADSLRFLEEAFRLEPDAPDVRFEFGRALYHADKLAQAAEVLESSPQPKDCRTHNLLARILSKQGKSAEAASEVHALAGCRDAPAAGVSR